MAKNSTLQQKILLQLVRVMRQPSTFLLDLFFYAVKEFESLTVEIDIVQEKRELAKFTHFDANPNLRQRDDWERQTHYPPYIKEGISIKPSDLQFARPGETIYSDQKLLSRLIEQIADDTYFLENLAKRKMEWMASKLLDGGTITISGTGFKTYTLNFKMPAGNQVTLTGGDRWSETSATPLADLRFMLRTIGQASGLRPNVIIFGSTAWESFLANAEVKAYLDMLWAKVVTIDPQHLPRGVAHYGRFEGADVFTYDEQFTDEGVTDSYINPDRVYFGSTDAETMRAHGAIQDFNHLSAAEFFIKEVDDELNSKKYLRLDSAPLLALSQSNAFGFLVA